MRILVGYDGSGGARAAIVDLARAGLPVDSEALVLAVADAVAPSFAPNDATTSARVARGAYQLGLVDAAACAEEGRALVQSVEPSWTVRHESRADSPSWTLLQRAETWKADLLVVGCKGRLSLDHQVVGSLAEKVLRHAPCNVRIGRGRPVQERPGAVRLVVGIDGSPGSDAVVATLLARKWPAGSAARVVTVVHPSAVLDFGQFGAGHATPYTWLRTVNEIAVEKLAAAGLDAVPILGEGDVRRALVEEAESWGADALFVGAHGLHGVQRELLGSVAAAVALRARCSVEVVRPLAAALPDMSVEPASASAAT